MEESDGLEEAISVGDLENYDIFEEFSPKVERRGTPFFDMKGGPIADKTNLIEGSADLKISSIEKLAKIKSIKEVSSFEVQTKNLMSPSRSSKSHRIKPRPRLKKSMTLFEKALDLDSTHNYKKDIGALVLKI